ncbi:MAG: ABC transporter permease [Candidatus Dependentiae bacterium]|nr:ABC transporter permease [Candidatus Dependentiae bacterium]
MVVSFLDAIGRGTLIFCDKIGGFVLFFGRIISTLCSSRLKYAQVLKQMEVIGIGSLGIVFLTGAFTGLAFALQSYIGFHRVGTEEFVGLVVTLGMTRELGPVLTGLMITGRCCSAMAAEIGTMRITEQIDALRTIGIDPYQYLIVPRVLAGTIATPILTLFSMVCGIVGGYLLSIYMLGLNPETYVGIILARVELSDVTGGLIKAAFFGFIFSGVGTYRGFHTSGGAQGVGRATTQSVVLGSILILVANYFLTSWLFQSGFS